MESRMRGSAATAARNALLGVGLSSLLLLLLLMNFAMLKTMIATGEWMKNSSSSNPAVWEFVLAEYKQKPAMLEYGLILWGFVRQQIKLLLNCVMDWIMIAMEMWMRN